MPKNTGIKSSEDYLKRLLEEDKKIAGKDNPYGRYLTSLTKLMELTNEIYEAGGKLDKDLHQKIVKQYMDVAQKGVEYKEKKIIQTRRNVVDHLQKIISKDLKAFISMDKENPGMIDDAFDASRAVKVVVSQELSHKIGAQSSDRFPMKSIDGTKGYFTARTDTAHESDWKEIIDSISQIGLDDAQMKVFNKLRNSHKFREKIVNAVIFDGLTEEKTFCNIAKEMGFYSSKSEAEEELFKPQQEKLLQAIKILKEKGDKLLTAYHMQNRLGNDYYTRNDNKNAAMYEVAKLLGCKQLVAKAVPMVVVNGDKVLKGTFMEHAKGSDLSNLKGNDPMWGYDPKTSPFNKNLYRDLADLQMLDYICGNIDRHKGNMIYKMKVDANGDIKMTGVTAIDNDASFPEGDISKEFSREIALPNIFKPQNFRFVNRETAKIVSGLNRGQLEILLRGHNLSKKAIDKAWDRVKDVKKALGKMKENNISFVDDLDDKAFENREDKNNPFMLNRETAKNPSIFTGFNMKIKAHLDLEKSTAYKKQLRRFEEQKKTHKERKLDMEEYKEFKDAQQREMDAKVAESKKVDKENDLLTDLTVIQRMDTLMGRVNRMKTPTEEFVKMRDAMAELSLCSQNLYEKLTSKTPLSADDYEKYEERLNNMKTMVENYIQKKDLSPKTTSGRERLDAAFSFQNRTEYLLSNLETVKKMDVSKEEMMRL